MQISSAIFWYLILLCTSVYKQCGFWLIIFKKAEFKVGWVEAWNLGAFLGEWRVCLHA